MTDNCGVVNIINKTTSKNRPIMKLVRQLVLACFKYILFRSRHIPGYQNVIALQINKATLMAPWLDSRFLEASSVAQLEHDLIRASLAPTTRASYRRSVYILRQY